MAITIDTTNKKTANTGAVGAGTLTISNFTVDSTTSADSVIVVGVSTGSDVVVDSITWNSRSFTKHYAFGDSNATAELWYLVTPTPGVTSNIVITMNTLAHVAATAVTFDEVYTTTPFDSVGTGFGLTQDATITYTHGADDDLAVLVVAKRDSTESDLTPGGGSTQQGESVTTDITAGNNVVHHFATEPLTSGSQVINATWTTTDRDWVAMVASLNWAKATYTWQGPDFVQLQGFPTTLSYGDTADIPRSVLQPYGVAGLDLDVDGSIGAGEDSRLLKS